MGLIEGLTMNFVLFIVVIISIYLGEELTVREIIKPKVRKVRGLDSIDMAIERAKEMGRPILYAGLNYGLRNSEVIASLNILGYVARRAAEIGVPLHVGVHHSTCLPAVKDVCETAARAVGKPEAFNPDNILWWSDSFVTYEQGLVEHATNVEPAAYFDFGYIQDENIVLPVYMAGQGIDCFCMAGCRQIQYTSSTLIGTDDWLLSEELYAAAAYVSGTKEAMGSIASADWLKLLAWILVIVGAIITLAGSPMFLDILRM